MSLLTKLAPKTVNLSGAGGGGGEVISGQDVASALNGLDRNLQIPLMLARGADIHPASSKELEAVLEQIEGMIVHNWERSVKKKAVRQRWVRPMAELLWLESIGRPASTDKLRYRYIGASKGTWRWLRIPYEQTFGDLEALFFAGLRHVSRKIGRD